MSPALPDARGSQEWKEMGLPEIDYHIHNKVESWRLFYGDVKVRRSRCGALPFFTLTAGPSAGALEKDGDKD
jgi:hypothetical protein